MDKYGTKKIKRPNRKPSIRPYRASGNNCWVVRFVYKGKQYSQSFGKGIQAQINAGIVATAILDDIKNDRFSGSIKNYLSLIPDHLKTWRKPPRKND